MSLSSCLSCFTSGGKVQLCIATKMDLSTLQKKNEWHESSKDTKHPHKKHEIRNLCDAATTVFITPFSYSAFCLPHSPLDHQARHDLRIFIWISNANKKAQKEFFCVCFGFYLSHRLLASLDVSSRSCPFMKVNLKPDDGISAKQTGEWEGEKNVSKKDRKKENEKHKCEKHNLFHIVLR